MSTEPLDVDEPAGAGGGKRKGPKTVATGAAPPRRPARVEEPEHATEVGWAVALSLSALILMGAVFVSWDVAKSDQSNATASGFSRWVGETFGGK